MRHHLLTLLLLLTACTFAREVVDDEGNYSRLFPKTPLSDAPCIEDQDCVVTPLKDGSCCPDPPHGAKNLYSKDQFDKLVSHQAQICGELEGNFTCPEVEPPTHIETVFRGACVENRCIVKEVPAEAPGSDVAPPPEPEEPPTPADNQATPEPEAPTPTAASPRPR